jgi:hypothetical protein
VTGLGGWGHSLLVIHTEQHPNCRRNVRCITRSHVSHASIASLSRISEVSERLIAQSNSTHRSLDASYKASTILERCPLPCPPRHSDTHSDTHTVTLTQSHTHTDTHIPTHSYRHIQTHSSSLTPNFKGEKITY